MIALPYRVKLEEPLLATSLGGDPNSSTSYPFIPGSLIRGALATRYGGARYKGNLALEETARRLFFGGGVRFLNAYPVDDEGCRMLPVPQAWVAEKGSAPPTSVRDWSLFGSDDVLKQPKVLGAPFCCPGCLEKHQVRTYQPLRWFSVHTQRNRRMGRATEASGAIFRYEALAPGQVFGGVILFDVGGEDVGTLAALLTDSPLLLGGSHSAGYGSVSVQVDQQEDRWREVGGIIADIAAGGLFTLTLLSDALLRNPWGQHVPALVPQALAKQLGVGRDGIEVCRVFAKTGAIGGFNRKWGLPLPQVPVVRAGSVFTLKANSPISVDAIAVLEAQGIGHRRVEGLGRVAVNWHGTTSELTWTDRIDLRGGASRSKVAHLPQLTGASLDLARRMTRRLVQREVESHLTDYIVQLEFRPGGISRSQLARLRVIVRSAQQARGTKRVAEWLEALKPTARKQFEGARVGGSKLMDWLKQRLDSPAQIWSELGLEEKSLPAIGGERVDLDKLAQDVTLQLVDAVLAKASEEARTHD